MGFTCWGWMRAVSRSTTRMRDVTVRQPPLEYTLTRSALACAFVRSTGGLQVASWYTTSSRRAWGGVRGKGTWGDGMSGIGRDRMNGSLGLE